VGLREDSAVPGTAVPGVVVPGADRPVVHDLEDKYRIEDGTVYMTGLQGLVRVVMDQMRADRRSGLRTSAFVSGYPGSPLAGFDKELGAHRALLDELDIVLQPGLNEELAATSVMGSQRALRHYRTRVEGVLGVWYGKAPGLDRATDAIRHACYFGTPRTGGVLAYVGDDPGSKSSTLPSASEHLMADLLLPVLCPGSVQEVLDLGLHGAALSRSTGLWVGMKVVATVADAAGTAEVRPERVRPVLPPGPDGGPPGLDTTIAISFANLLGAERHIHEVRMPAALEYAALNGLNPVSDVPQAWIGVVAPGHVHAQVMQAFVRLGLDEAALRRLGIRLLSMGMIHPVDPSALRRFATGLEEVVVVEERRPFLEPLVRDALYGMPDAPRVLGKRDEAQRALIPSFGVLDVDALAEPLRRRLIQRVDAADLAPLVEPRPRTVLVARQPYFCSGCPHNTGAKVPEGTLVGNGIGCHGMVGWMDPERFGTVTGPTQMGGEGAQMIGIAPFVDADHFVQNVGDGTYFHSGQLAVQAAVAAGTHMTFKILFNAAVAMTGGQDVVGHQSPATMAGVLLAQGVKRVIITTEDLRRYRSQALPEGADVWDRARIVEAQVVLRETPGVTVLIHDQQCAAEARRLRRRGKQADPPMRVVISPRVCEGCGDCATKSNCLSVLPTVTEFGTKRVIEQTSCNKDYSCLQGDCPSFLTVKPRRRRAGRTRSAGASGGRAPAISVDELPEPVLSVPADATIRMPGIGGTGVVTVSQVLGTAATLAGLHVGGLDATGLAQKGGPVVSDLRVQRTPIAGTGRVEAGGVDLYLVFDAVVGTAPANLAGADPERTVAVVSTVMQPTGPQIASPGAAVADFTPFREAIASASRGDVGAFVDPQNLARRLFGSTAGANVLLLGVAYQLGAVPVPAAAIEQALELNGVATEMNIQAFRWGRLHVVDPDRVAAHGAPTVASPRRVPALPAELQGTGALEALAGSRAADLVGYQGVRLARRYLEQVVAVRRAEERVAPGSDALSQAVARYLYKLMAYKDEYEVARLMLEETSRAAVAEVSGGRPVKVSWNLHPPVLRSLGMRRKIGLGRWFTPGFGALRGMRRLRGTPFDPFGHTRVRKTERALVVEYERLIARALETLTAETYPATVRLAEAPDQVRGYESVKMASVERYRAAVDELCAEIGISA
jgi:indolepyruvate ferredoxin oxidoreductase